jgi:hypothetical protein
MPAATGTAGVSPARVECHNVRVDRFNCCLMISLLEAGETPAVSVSS